VEFYTLCKFFRYWNIVFGLISWFLLAAFLCEVRTSVLLLKREYLLHKQNAYILGELLFCWRLVHISFICVYYVFVYQSQGAFLNWHAFWITVLWYWYSLSVVCNCVQHVENKFVEICTLFWINFKFNLGCELWHVLNLFKLHFIYRQ